MGRADLIEALTVLGLDPTTTDPVVVRRAFASAIRVTHPDRSGATDAAEQSARLILAYRTATAVLLGGIPDPEGPEYTDRPEYTAPPDTLPPDGIDLVQVVADDTIEVAAPLDVTFGWLVQAGHLAGDVTFLDRSAAMLQILVAFVDEPLCQMIFDLQGRAVRGTTEVFCTIDSIEDRPAPPIDAVTRFVADRLAEVVSAGE